MSGALVAAGVIAAGSAAYAGYASNQASKKAANAMRSGVQTFDPIEPNAPRTVDWQRVVNDALGYNTNNFGRVSGLAGLINNFNTRQAQNQYRAMQPHFDQLQRQLGQNALSYSRGELPSDVVQSLGRAASQRGLQGGFGMGARGAGAGTALSALNLRNLGLTSLDLSKFGSQLALNAGIQAKQLSPGLYDPTQLMVNPNQAVGYAYQNAGILNDADRYWNQLQNQALMGNVSAQNTANTNATNTQLAGQLAQNQAIAQAGSSLAGGIGTYATNQPYNYGTPVAGAPSGGAVAGYGYRPQSGYYPLS